MKRGSIWLVLGALIASISLLATTASAGTNVKPRKGGTVIFGADQEPNGLNPGTEDHFWASLINQMPITGAHVLTPFFTYKPYHISRVRVQQRPFRLTYYIKKSAMWYEPGARARPVTAADFIFTWRTVMDKRWEIITTVGYEDIARARALNSKTVLFTFKKPFAGYKTIFNALLPAHALQGANFNDVWDNNLNNPKTNRPIANGPYYLERWERGRQATLRRNPLFKSTRAPLLDRVVVRFLPDTNTTAQQIRGGEVDVIYPQPQAFLVPLRSQRGLRMQVGLGPVWEHIDFNMGYHKAGTPPNPLLKNKWVREAIFRAVNRAGIVKALYRDTRIAPSLGVLNSQILVANQKGYKAHYAKYRYGVANVTRIMRAHNCTRGGDGIYSCQGRRMSFRLSTTAGNALRVLAEEIIQAQAKSAGIEIKIENDPGRLLFDKRLPEGNYDMAMYAWVGSPDITGWDNVYGCRNDATNQAQQNRQGYCNKRVDSLMKKVNLTFSESQQKVIMNQALALLANDVNNIPLFQKPTYLIHKTAFRGLVENPTSWGPAWNIESWWRTTA